LAFYVHLHEDLDALRPCDDVISAHIHAFTYSINVSCHIRKLRSDRKQDGGVERSRGKEENIEWEDKRRRDRDT
jgi:hypothetical protein